MASDGHTRAHAECLPFIISLEFIIDLFTSLLFRSWLALYGAGVPPTPSGQAEAEHVRFAPTAEWVSLHRLGPREVACARPGRAVRLAPMDECRRWADELECEAHYRTYCAQPDGRLPSPTP